MGTPVPDVDGRSRLLAAAYELFAERGVEAVSVRLLAERAQVTAGLVTHHFGSKDGLIEQVDAYALGLCSEILAGAMAAAGERPDGDARPIAGVQDAITDALSDQPVLRGYIGRRLVSDSAAGQQFFGQFAQLVEAGLRQLRSAGAVRDSIDHMGATVLVVHLILGPIVLARQWSQLAGIDAFDPRLVAPVAAATSAVLEGGLFEPEPAR
ncbi:MAG: helix-turn-helix domain-containing protein [Solirubrobacteraceae bacterium]|nr:helix-turn-helix domain-containing protein [Patulibacter sp.]